MLKIAFHPIYAHPLPEGHRFPMLKYELIPGQLLHEGTISADNLFEPGPMHEAEILRVHDSEYWRRLKNLQLSAKEIRKIGFPLSAQLIQREIIIAQGTLEASQFALEYGVAMNVAGGTHHAYAHSGEGFCLLNDQAIAAAWLLEHHLAKRILIIDLDVHQGNGTASIFKNESRVFTFSMHGKDNYPMYKEQSDLDIALKAGTSDEEYLDLLQKNLPKLIHKHQADFIFYQAGVDVLATDKLGKLSLSMAGCANRDAYVFNQAIAAGIPMVVCMGGGYSPEIKDILEAHCNTYRLAQRLWFDA
ncbi:MAG: histone deacetylase [Bacteroidia bacterium]